LDDAMDQRPLDLDLAQGDEPASGHRHGQPPYLLGVLSSAKLRRGSGVPADLRLGGEPCQIRADHIGRALAGEEPGRTERKAGGRESCLIKQLSASESDLKISVAFRC